MTSRTEPSGVPAMPALLRGRRRGLMGLLVLTALAHTALAVGSGLQVGGLLGDVGAHPGRIVADLSLLFLCVLGLGMTRYADRVLAERLGQDYVQELRRGLVRHAMTAESAPSLGITIARSTNDLSSVRNWVSLGIAPLVAFVPLALGSLGLLWFIAWQLAVATAVPLLLLGAALALLSGPAFERARTLRRRRGSLAARVADTVTAAPGVVAAGGVGRELRALDRSGSKVIDAAVDRARTAGLLRSAALTVPLLASGAAAGLGAFGIVAAAAVATALTVIGILGGPVAEMGRVVEYRQNYRAARRILAPLLLPGPAAAPLGPTTDASASGDGRVVVEGLVVGDRPVPRLRAEPGDRIRVESTSAAPVRELFAGLAAPAATRRGSVCVDGHDLASASSRTRRELVGHAAQGARVERGTLGRAVRYRRPDLDEDVTVPALARVGLGELVLGLPDGERTQLRRGGEPLERGDLARVLLARATLGDPPLLLLEHLDSDLDADGTRLLKKLLEDYPGVVVFASDDPARVTDTWRAWSLDAESSLVDRQEPRVVNA